MKSSRPILFATDFSKASGPAWEEAVALAEKTRSELLVAHVLHVPLPFSPEGPILPQTADDLEAAARRQAVADLQSLVRRTEKRGVHSTGLLLTGRADQAVARAAKRHHARIVVVGTRGRTGLPRLLLGSVAARILAAAPCPVLAVPRKSRQAALAS